MILLVPGVVGSVVFLPAGIALLVMAGDLAVIAIMREKLRGRLQGAIVLLVISGLVAGLAYNGYMQRRWASGHNRASCLSNLSNFSRSLALYQEEYRSPPPDLQALLKDGWIGTNGLTCLNDPRRGAAGTVSYCYLPPIDKDPTRIVAADASLWHGGKRCVLTADGSVKAMSEAEFQKQLASPLNKEFQKVVNRPQ